VLSIEKGTKRCSGVPENRRDAIRPDMGRTESLFCPARDASMDTSRPEIFGATSICSPVWSA
jgi:hypothetical protein